MPIVGVKHGQDEMMSLLVDDDALFKGRITEWQGLQNTGRHIDVKQFLFWKTARIVGLADGERRTDAWHCFAGSVARLDTVKTVDSALARELCSGLGREDRSLRGKVTRLLRKYRKRCGETIRVVCALNETRARQSRKQRDEKIAELSRTTLTD